MLVRSYQRYTQALRGEISQPSWMMPGKHLFPDHLPQRRVVFPTAGMRVAV
jgi:hypothetical protein